MFTTDPSLETRPTSLASLVRQIMRNKGISPRHLAPPDEVDTKLFTSFYDTMIKIPRHRADHIETPW